MFDFIFNPGVNDLIPETNRYSHTLRMRMQKNKVKYGEVLSLPKKVIALRNSPSYYDALQEAFKIFKESLYLCQECSDYGFYTEVRNMYDYQFHLNDLALANNANNDLLSKEQASIFIEVFKGLMPYMEDNLQVQTQVEAKRKEIIEKAGMIYERHIYPDYRECDQLFAYIPEGPDDPVFAKAKSILNMH